MKKVYKNDGTIPAEEILCTTYQMRNFYRQFGDGFISKLDVMNYIQHLKACSFMKKGDIVLDVCCGRGLVLPFIRFFKKNIKKYIGVDIEEKNLESRLKDVRNNKPIDIKTFYPFEVEFVISNVKEMSLFIKEKIDFIIYTSAIEHMQKKDGELSLRECSRLIKEGGILFLSCPNTPETQDGFDVRYKAHVYEWKLSELREELHKNNFIIQKEIGLVGDSKDFELKLRTVVNSELRTFFLQLKEYLPSEFFLSTFFIPYPEISSEVLIIAQKQKGTQYENLFCGDI